MTFGDLCHKVRWIKEADALILELSEAPEDEEAQFAIAELTAAVLEARMALAPA